MIKISSKKLAELRTYYLDGKDADPDTVIEAFELANQEELEAYLEGLRQKFPEDFPAVPGEAEEQYTYFLKGDNNLLQELEIFRNKKGVILFTVKEPKDMVTLVIKGKTITVDLIQLAKYPQDTPHGVTNARVIEMAEIARG